MTQKRKIAFAKAVAKGVMVYFGFWFCIDVVTVRFLDYPRQAHALDYLLLGFPIVLLALTSWWLNGRVLVALAATALACLIMIPLFFLVGVPLHCAIGGSL